MKKIMTTVFILGCVVFASGVLYSQDLKVFGISKDREAKNPKKVDLEKKRDYLSLDIGMNESFQDSILRLERVSTSFYDDFYIENWKDNYNLLIERCMGSENCDSFVLHHYAKNVKGFIDPKSKKKYLRIGEDEYNLNRVNCSDIFRITIENEEIQNIEYPEGAEYYGKTKFTEKKTVLKQFYIYFCY
jgi:hypothetical protein